VIVSQLEFGGGDGRGLHMYRTIQLRRLVINQRR
jgi:hypothetical protein